MSCTPIAARLSLGARTTAAQRSLITPTFCGACSASACDQSLLSPGLGTAMSRPKLCVAWYGQRHGQMPCQHLPVKQVARRVPLCKWAFSKHA